VTVWEDVQVVDVLFEDGKAEGVRYATGGSSSSAVAHARFVVDASGQRALLGHKLGLRRWDAFFQNLAVYGYFGGAQCLPESNQNNIFIESVAQGWLWAIPLHTGRMSVGVVVDSTWGQDAIRRQGLRSFYLEQIAGAPHVQTMLREARLVREPAVIKDWSYQSERIAGDGYALAGDAACFVDPLFSSGVHLALMAGVLAAAYVTTALKDDGMREAAGRVYEELYAKQYGYFREMAKLFYASNRSVESYFWEARRLLGNDEAVLPRHAFIQAVAGQSPLGYERVVLERGHVPAAFAGEVQAIQEERAARGAELMALFAQPKTVEHVVLRLVPRLAEGVQVERKPVLAEGEFVPGYVLKTAGYPEGTPCSAFVAKLISLVDGRTPISGLITGLGGGQEEAADTQLLRIVLSTIQILYLGGTIAELQGCR
ncbi:MAG: NAD(P)/FAD-dependent oxidoreductase, partial [Dehalococcoidia bacterium]